MTLFGPQGWTTRLDIPCPLHAAPLRSCGSCTALPRATRACYSTNLPFHLGSSQSRTTVASPDISCPLPAPPYRSRGSVWPCRALRQPALLHELHSSLGSGVPQAAAMGAVGWPDRLPRATAGCRVAGTLKQREARRQAKGSGGGKRENRFAGSGVDKR